MKDLASSLVRALDANDFDEQERLDQQIAEAPITSTDDMAIFVQRLRSWSRDLESENPASHVIREGLDRIAEILACNPTKYLGDYYGAPVAAFQH